MNLLTTARLNLREWRVTDARALFHFASLPGVFLMAGWSPLLHYEEAIALVRKFIAKNDTWAIVPKKRINVIGFVGLTEKIDDSGGTVLELGFVLHPKYADRGYMTEACSAVIAYAFEGLKRPILKACHFTDNDRSRRVIEKCGFIYEREIVFNSQALKEQPTKEYYMTYDIYKQWRTDHE